MWEEIIAPLGLHQLSQHSVQQTVNRLFRKSLGTKLVKKITRELYKIDIEYWSLSTLKTIRVRIPHKRASPRIESHPIILVQYKSEFYLIDGANKINKWKVEKNKGPHKVAIIRRRAI